MKYFILLCTLLGAMQGHASELSPKEISKAYFEHELKRHPVVSMMRAAKSVEEKAEFQRQLQAIWDFEKQYKDAERVKRNSDSWYHVNFFVRLMSTWAESNSMKIDEFLIRSKVQEEDDAFAVVDVFVEQKKCVLELNRFDMQWKITKELCPNKI